MAQGWCWALETHSLEYVWGGAGLMGALRKVQALGLLQVLLLSFRHGFQPGAYPSASLPRNQLAWAACRQVGASTYPSVGLGPVPLPAME